MLAFCTGIFATLTGLLYQMGARFFSRETALVATAIFVLNPMFSMNYTLYGFLDPSFALVMWLVTLAIIRTFEAEDPVRWALVAGLTTGLAYLVRYNVYLSAPIYLVLVIWGVRSRRWLCGLIYVLGFACGYLLVMAYNLNHFGIPAVYQTSSWVLAEQTISSSSPWRDYAVYSSWDIVTAHSGLVLLKLWQGVTNVLLQNIVRLHNLQFLIPFTVAGFFLARERRQRALLLVMGVPFVVQLLAFASTHPELGLSLRWTDRYYFWACPLVLLFGADGLRYFLGEVQRPRLAMAAFFALLLFSMVRWWQPLPTFDPDEFFAREYLTEELPDDAFVVTNLFANDFSYYYRTTTMEFPYDPHVIGAVQRHWDIDVILIAFTPEEMSFLTLWLEEMQRDRFRAFGEAYGFRHDRTFVDDEGRAIGFALRSTRDEDAPSP